MGEQTALVGRDETIGLVTASMERPATGGREFVFRPVLVLEDARGGGKTSLITSVQESLAGSGIPFAIVDLQEQQPGTLKEVIYAIAYQLSRDWGAPYREIAFPRLAKAEQVASMTLPAQRSLARDRVESIVITSRFSIDAMRGVLADAAGDLADGALRQFGIPGVLTGPLRDIARSVPGVVGAILRRRWPFRSVMLGRHYFWFGDRGVGRPKNPGDELVDLNRFSRPEAYERNREWVDELLLAALLADLTEHFTEHIEHKFVDYGCTLLIDNADHELGRALVNALVEARRQPGAAPDPLTVVVTSRGVLLGGMTEHHEFADLGTDTRAPSDGVPWTTRLAELPSPWIARRRLCDLTPDGTAAMVAWAGDLSGSHPRVTKCLVHEMTGGQPVCTRALVSVIGDAPGVRDDPRGLLDVAAPARLDADRRPLREWMLTYLTNDHEGDLLPGLMRCAAALSPEDTPALSGLKGIGRRSFMAADTLLWPYPASAASGLVRRLLVERLANDQSDSWRDVFTRLRQFALDEERALAEAIATAGEAGAEQQEEMRRLQLSRLAYGLALGDVLPAATWLADHLSPRLTSTQWLGCLETIASAPHRCLPGTSSPWDEFERHQDQLPGVPDLPLIGEIGTLLIGRWITGDRLTDARRGRIYGAMEDSARTVRPEVPHRDQEPFRLAAERFRREKEFWL